jgi:hypothetical protein
LLARVNYGPQQTPDPLFFDGHDRSKSVVSANFIANKTKGAEISKRQTPLIASIRSGSVAQSNKIFEKCSFLRAFQQTSPFVSRDVYSNVTINKFMKSFN